VLWQNLSVLASVLVLPGVLTLVVTRPRGLNVAWPAGVGALLVILLGLLSPAALQEIFTTTWDAVATLIALFLLSEALDSNKFFTWAALHLARFARGSGWRLYILVLLLTLGVTALLANDGAILMLTPIFAQLLLRIYPKESYRLPFLFAAGFFADAMSAIFVPSNLTNIIIADANRLSFIDVAAWMALPTLAAFLAGMLVFALRWRTVLNFSKYDVHELERPADVLKDRVVFLCGWIALATLVVGYIIGGKFHWPISLVAAPVALAMVVLVQIRQTRSARQIFLSAPWSILIYALGMFVVITAAFNTQMLGFLTTPLKGFVAQEAGSFQALDAGGLLALLSATVNNLPATLIGVLVLRSLKTPSLLAIYAIILGVDIGPKLTPFGSLATLLWLGILQRNGISISWGKYLRENWWVTLIVLIAAFAGLLVSNMLLS
jgi:arsenical pump membrane protein